MRACVLLIPMCLFGALPALADELPKRKAGLWEIKMTVGGREIPLRNVQQCTDAETDALMSASLTGVAGNKCEESRISNSGGTVTVDATCKIGSALKTTRAVITGDLDSAYTIAVTSMPAGGVSKARAEPGREPHMTMQAKWLGPCRQGQQPGDIILPGGIKINVRSLAIGPGAPARQ